MNEQFLHRVAADLHDGPAQNVAVALLRLDTLADTWGGCAAPMPGPCSELAIIRSAMHSCLDELRAIAAGLHIPEIERLSLGEAARRAVRDFERKSGMAVELDVDERGEEGPLAIKITLYRVLQEALTNGWRHAEESALRVCLRIAEG